MGIRYGMSCVNVLKPLIKPRSRVSKIRAVKGLTPSNKRFLRSLGFKVI